MPTTASSPSAAPQAQEHPKRLLSRDQAAKALGVSVRMVDALIATEALRSVKLGRCRKVRTEDLDSFVASLAS